VDPKLLPLPFWAARQVAQQQQRTLSENARALALINMAISDSLVSAFFNKYHYNFWRPETAIRAGDTDGNPKTVADPDFLPTPAGEPGLNYLCAGYKHFFHYIDPYLQFMASELRSGRPPANIMWIVLG
jgi:hypothetical protein